MDENKINLAKKDNRVNIEFLIREKIHTFSAIPSNNRKGIIIYCHGLGSNKEWITRFYNRLLEESFLVFSFDFPGHGNDTTNFHQFTLDLCINYLNEVIDYIKKRYNLPIYLFGCSFGGFVILNRLLDKCDDIKETILMCPAINFYEILKNKTDISDNYFRGNSYLPLYNNIKIYKETYNEFKYGEKQIKLAKFSHISIIQGNLDKTVNYKKVVNFCNKNNLKLSIIQNGKHELYGYDNEISNFIISVISK